MSAGTGYLLENRATEAGSRFDALSTLFDPWTFAHLDAVGTGPGWRCWEVGAGGPSVPRWMTGRVGPCRSRDGDRHRRLLARPTTPATRCCFHDVEHEPPPDAYDLVHARLVLTHLPGRDRRPADHGGQPAPRRVGGRRGLRRRPATPRRARRALPRALPGQPPPRRLRRAAGPAGRRSPLRPVPALEVAGPRSRRRQSRRLPAPRHARHARARAGQPAPGPLGAHRRRVPRDRARGPRRRRSSTACSTSPPRRWCRRGVDGRPSRTRVGERRRASHGPHRDGRRWHGRPGRGAAPPA